ncbi:uncharacterized protein [Periplaneta americana]|uniref:uncharacterized protein n=1 Tax=Periplaneta americana TaxID=6978 RepID=UPI0037E979B0
MSVASQLQQSTVTPISTSGIPSLPGNSNSTSEPQLHIQLLLLQILAQLEKQQECHTTRVALEKEKVRMQDKEQQFESSISKVKIAERQLENSLSSLQLDNQQLRKEKCNFISKCHEKYEEELEEIQEHLQNVTHRVAELESQLKRNVTEAQAKWKAVNNRVLESKLELSKLQNQIRKSVDQEETCSCDESCLKYYVAGSDTLHLQKNLIEFLNDLEEHYNMNMVNNVSNYLWTPLHVAAAFGNPAVVQTLLKFDADINTTDIDGVSPLMLASSRGKLEAAQILISRNAALDPTDGRGFSVLHKAIFNGSTDIVRELLCKGGIAINNPSGFGDFPLHLAVYFNRKEIAELLLQSGFPVDSTDRNNDTPLHTAAANGNLPMIKILVGHKANVSAENLDGRTPLHLAIDEGHQEVYEFLKKSITNN